MKQITNLFNNLSVIYPSTSKKVNNLYEANFQQILSGNDAIDFALKPPVTGKKKGIVKKVIHAGTLVLVRGKCAKNFLE